MNRLWVLLAVLALMLPACGGDDGADGEVLPFEDIQAGPVSFEFNPSATGGNLRVDTSIDAVCAVSYGLTEELGQIGTDPDMGGEAHDDHHAVLLGLEPDTEYFYRLQGVGVDGNLYQSELLTFRTPAASGVDSANVALNATVSDVSSEFSATFAAGNAIDGDPTTEWSSRGDGDDAFIEIDLGAATAVTAVEFTTRSMGDGTSITSEFTVAVDGAAPLGPFPTDQRVVVDFTGRLIRFDVSTSTGGNTGAVDIAVYTDG